VALLTSPDVFAGLNRIMLDIPLALLCLLATLAWAKYLIHGTARWSLAFSLFAAAAILTKGNGFLLTFVPPLSVLLCARPQLLKDWRFWIPVLIVGPLTIPWHAATYQMTADGFNETWGLAFTARALRSNGRMLLHLIGIPGLALALVGAGQVMAGGLDGWKRILGICMLSSIIGGILLHSLVPVAITARYLTTLVAPLLVLAYFGTALLAHLGPPRAARLTVIAGFLVIVIGEANPATKASLKMPDAYASIVRAGEDNPFVLICSGPEGEGAIIAEAATQDRSRARYIIRGSKALSTGDFMGINYRARFAGLEELKNWIEKRRIGWLILDTSPSSLGWAHNQQLRQLGESSPRGWTLTGRFPHETGETLVYRIESGFGPKIDTAPLLAEIAQSRVLGR
jgi:hypothetical protein